MCKLTYKRLDLDERISIQVALSQGHSYGAIAASLGRSKSSIQREVAPWGRQKYKAAKAHDYGRKGAVSRKRGKVKITANTALVDYIGTKLELRWSPEQIRSNPATNPVLHRAPPRL